MSRKLEFSCASDRTEKRKSEQNLSASSSRSKRRRSSNQTSEAVIDLTKHEEKADENHFEKLDGTPEILANIFANLPMLDLVQVVNRVCRQWNRAVRNERFLKWKKLYFKYRKTRTREMGNLVGTVCEEFFDLDKSLIALLKFVNTNFGSIPTPSEFDRLTATLEKEANHRCVVWFFETCWPKYTTQKANIWTRICLTMLLSSSYSALTTCNVLEDLVFRCPTQKENIFECVYLLAALLLVSRRRLGISDRFHYNVYSALYFLENSGGKSVTDLRPEKGITPTKCGQQSLHQYLSPTKNALSPPSGDQKSRTKRLTFEQFRVVNYSLGAGECVKIIALAGTGKTSTLIEYVRARPNWNFLVVMYNKGVCADVKKHFPPNAECRTTHSLAYGHRVSTWDDCDTTTLGGQYRGKLAGSLTYSIVSGVLNNKLKGVGLYEQANLAIKVVDSFLASDQDEIGLENVPETGLDDSQSLLCLETQTELVQVAQNIWNAMKDPRSFHVKMTHDGYLKLFQLEKPQLLDKNGKEFDAILVDEAQDMNPAILDVIKRQKAPRIFVGDPNQQIYAFRGAINALDAMNDVVTRTFYLTQSFRFGPEIGFIANAWLENVKKGHTTMLIGSRKEDTVVEERNGIRQLCVICRSNSTVFRECTTSAGVEYSRQLPKPRLAVVGGIETFGLDDMLDIHNLRRPEKERRTFKSKFVGRFKSFAELTAYAQGRYDKELQRKIQIVQTYGDQIPNCLEQIKSCLTKQLGNATVIITTAHKSKGMEFEAVRLADDFFSADELEFVKYNFESRISQDQLENENNLLYVAITRPRKLLIMSRQLYAFLRFRAHENFDFVSPASEGMRFVSQTSNLAEQLRCQKCRLDISVQQDEKAILMNRPLTLAHREGIKTTYSANFGAFCPSCSRNSDALSRVFRYGRRGDLNDPESAQRANDDDSNSFLCERPRILSEEELSHFPSFGQTSDFTRQWLRPFFEPVKGEN